MQPRLKSSKKWTSLPQEVTEQIQEVFKQNFQKDLGKAQVVVEGRLYLEEIVLRVGYLEPGHLAQNNFEVSIDYSPESENAALETLHLCVDVAASLMMEYFENDRELDLPEKWAEFPFDNHKVWLQFSTVNSDLEKQANELLGEETDALLQGDFEVEFEIDAESSEDDDGEGSSGNGTLH